MFKFFILLEFQSTVDRFMALRMLHYIIELYEDLVNNHKLKTLPAVFPVLLYNGEKRWTAPEELSILIENSIPEKYIPGFSYYKIAENEFSKEFLKSLKNSVAALFYTENCRGEEIQREIDTIVDLLKSEKPDELTLFIKWFTYMFNERTELVEEVQSIEEVNSMLRTSLKKYGKKLSQEARHEEKMKIATALIRKKMPEKEISDITGLSVEVITKLIK